MLNCSLEEAPGLNSLVICFPVAG
jgi:hypothetical protein